MNPQDFKALLDVLKDINGSLDAIFKTLYLATQKVEPGQKPIKVNDLAPLNRFLKQASEQVSDKTAKELLRTAKTMLIEVQNEGLK